MNIKQKAKDELETRVQKLESFIEKRGVGSSYLKKAKKVQRTANIAIVVSAAVTITAVSIWALSKLNKEE